jgi:predicted negative regulator of RcsB-dependent stress response
MDSNIVSTGQWYSLLGWVDKNRKQIISALVICVIAGVLIGFMTWRSSQRRIEAGQKLSALVADAAGKSLSVESLTQLATEYTGTDAAARALLMAGGQAFADGKLAEAEALFQRFVGEYDGHPLLAQAKLGIAVCLDAQGKATEATAAFKEVVDRFPNANTITSARFNLASLYEAQGKPEMARDIYMTLTQDSQSTYGAEAIARLTEMFQKNPSLRPNAAMPAPAPATVPPAS